MDTMPRRCIGDVGRVRSCAWRFACAGAAAAISIGREPRHASTPTSRRTASRSPISSRTRSKSSKTIALRRSKTSGSSARRAGGHAIEAGSGRPSRESRAAAADPEARVFVVFFDTWHVSFDGSAKAAAPVSELLNRIVGAERSGRRHDAGHSGARAVADATHRGDRARRPRHDRRGRSAIASNVDPREREIDRSAIRTTTRAGRSSAASPRK